MLYIFHPLVLLVFGLPSFVIGLGPALSAGLLSCVVARMTNRPALRLALSPIIGALGGSPIYGLIGLVRYSNDEPQRWTKVAAAAEGIMPICAIASLICTLILEWRGLSRTADRWKAKSQSGANRP